MFAIAVKNIKKAVHVLLQYAFVEIIKLEYIWATPWENVSLGVSDQARHKPACTATEAS